MILEEILAEYRRYQSMAELAVAQISEKDVQKIFGDEGNSIEIIMNHVSGNLRSRFTNFLTEDGEKLWRNRDSEFEEQNKTKEQLLADWKESFEIVFKEVGSLTIEALNNKIKIRGNELTVSAALERSLAHTSYHVGQIVLLAKFFAGNKWKTLSIPKGKSQEYNSNPTKEKIPNK